MGIEAIWILPVRKIKRARRYRDEPSKVWS